MYPAFQLAGELQCFQLSPSQANILAPFAFELPNLRSFSTCTLASGTVRNPVCFKLPHMTSTRAGTIKPNAVNGQDWNIYTLSFSKGVFARRQAFPASLVPIGLVKSKSEQTNCGQRRYKQHFHADAEVEF